MTTQTRHDLLTAHLRLAEQAFARALDAKVKYDTHISIAEEHIRDAQALDDQLNIDTQIETAGQA